MKNEIFSPESAKSLANLELKAKLVVEGFITGLHKSPFHGFSVEFSEHRQYRPGDEIRHIDWQVFARSNKFYVKQFEEETNLRCTIVVDSSKSMAFSSDSSLPTKYNYSVFLAALMAYILNRQRDAVGLSIFNNDIDLFMPPKSTTSYIGELIKNLEKTIPSNNTSTSNSLNKLVEKIKRRGLVIIISDFFDEIDQIESVLNNFRHYNHEIILFQILDPKEIEFDFNQNTNFVDLETEEEILTSPNLIKKEYRIAIQNYIESLKSICYNKKIDYNLLTTNESFDKALLKFISKRNKL